MIYQVNSSQLSQAVLHAKQSVNSGKLANHKPLIASKFTNDKAVCMTSWGPMMRT